MWPVCWASLQLAGPLASDLIPHSPLYAQELEADPHVVPAEAHAGNVTLRAFKNAAGGLRGDLSSGCDSWAVAQVGRDGGGVWWVGQVGRAGQGGQGWLSLAPNAEVSPSAIPSSCSLPPGFPCFLSSYDLGLGGGDASGTALRPAPHSSSGGAARAARGGDGPCGSRAGGSGTPWRSGRRPDGRAAGGRGCRGSGGSRRRCVGPLSCSGSRRLASSVSATRRFSVTLLTTSGISPLL